MFTRILAAAAVSLGAGCGHHTIRVDSEPSGARLSVNGRLVGVTPTQFEETGDYIDNLFVFKYEKDGYETRVEEQRKTEFCFRHLVDLRPYYIGILRKKPPATPPSPAAQAPAPAAASAAAQPGAGR